MSGGLIAIIIVVVTIGGITASVVSYFRLQRHRADAVAMAGYRKLAEEAVANAEQALADQQALRAQLTELTSRLAAIEKLLRSVG
jgi:hypothetical protein